MFKYWSTTVDCMAMTKMEKKAKFDQCIQIFVVDFFFKDFSISSLTISFNDELHHHYIIYFSVK